MNKKWKITQMQETHRPSALKQKNKAHKSGRHRSKSEIDAALKGKVSAVQVVKKFRSDATKKERRNQSSQLRFNKREELVMCKRLMGGANSPPILITIVPLGFDVIPEKFMDFIYGTDPGSTVTCSARNVFHVNIPRMKQRFSFILPSGALLNSILDAVRVSDAVVFLLSAKSTVIVDDDSAKILSILTAQGLPSPNVALMDVQQVGSLHKQHSVKADLEKALSHWLPDVNVIKVGNNDDAVTFLRRLVNQKPQVLLHRSNRSYLLAEEMSASSHDTNAELVTVKLTGYLRGQPLSVNGLVHVPGWGDFQVAQIDAPADPFAIVREEGPTEVLKNSNPDRQISLLAENVPDPMDAEQTWPTDLELKEAGKKTAMKKVPKGTSDYQACWIPDDNSDYEEAEKKGEEEEEEDPDMDAASEEAWQENDGEVESVQTVTENDNYDAEMDIEEEATSYERLQEARQEAAFPDEVDTPTTVPARQRFAKYRGLLSFRTSPWDPKENLPPHYARIFQFENFNRTRKIVADRSSELLDSVTPGRFITIHIKNVSKNLVEQSDPNDTVVLFGLLPHEQCMSVVNFVVKRCNASNIRDVPVKSKDPVVIHCGFRRYSCRPIYSQHTNGSKHKYERFFQPHSLAVATTYAPIMYPPAPVLVFSHDGQSLIATGRLLSVDPDRLIIKRVVLSGHPFRVLKHSAIIRFMFFNRDDIEWFKPVELRTKYGRRGHIKEPLGTHGHMKAVFDDQLKSQDTVLMPLFKRVFPPWSYQVQNTSPVIFKKISLMQSEAPMF